MGDLSSGRAFDNGCTCFDSCQGVVNDLRGKRIECSCNVSEILCIMILWSTYCTINYVKLL